MEFSPTGLSIRDCEAPSGESNEFGRMTYTRRLIVGPGWEEVAYPVKWGSQAEHERYITEEIS